MPCVLSWLSYSWCVFVWTKSSSLLLPSCLLPLSNLPHLWVSFLRVPFPISCSQFLYASLSWCSVFELKCAVQEYAWGKKGEDSAVAQLKASVDADFTVNPDASYAEVRLYKGIGLVNSHDKFSCCPSLPMKNFNVEGMVQNLNYKLYQAHWKTRLVSYKYT